jgi:hypothetical protein
VKLLVSGNSFIKNCFDLAPSQARDVVIRAQAGA